jgi:hypothetical protein
MWARLRYNIFRQALTDPEFATQQKEGLQTAAMVSTSLPDVALRWQR